MIYILRIQQKCTTEEEGKKGDQGKRDLFNTRPSDAINRSIAGCLPGYGLEKQQQQQRRGVGISVAIRLQRWRLAMANETTKGGNIII